MQAYIHIRNEYCTRTQYTEFVTSTCREIDPKRYMYVLQNKCIHRHIYILQYVADISAPKEQNH